MVRRNRRRWSGRKGGESEALSNLMRAIKSEPTPSKSKSGRFRNKGRVRAKRDPRKLERYMYMAVFDKTHLRALFSSS
ncbi:hypothetical protein SAY87_011461 [Trapa incisa]|uniref:Uncharacterized protein n=1 Tax=Trapa incisa TaxID=236973 RepID=A0AAN7JIB6_9MYRT|nr:hypothetical protein SAY87_011461 [Trapa incisa]